MTTVREVPATRISGVYLLYGLRYAPGLKCAFGKDRVFSSPDVDLGWKYYVGQSVNIGSRIYSHASDSWKNLRAVVLQECPAVRDVLEASESRFIAASMQLNLPLANKKNTLPPAAKLDSFGSLANETEFLKQAVGILRLSSASHKEQPEVAA